ncbi:MAG: hypothetical protein PHC61_16050, partial [Chitinivibrionales bacterium]|nr:hypothetical protein [Chitinivibrionales bacterium]
EYFLVVSNPHTNLRRVAISLDLKRIQGAKMEGKRGKVEVSIFHIWKNISRYRKTRMPGKPSCFDIT